MNIIMIDKERLDEFVTELAKAVKIEADLADPLGQPIFHHLPRLHCSQRTSGQTSHQKAVYLSLEIITEGMKELLGLWVSENQGAKFWLSVLTELQNRGV